MTQPNDMPADVESETQAEMATEAGVVEDIEGQAGRTDVEGAAEPPGPVRADVEGGSSSEI